MPGPYQRLDVPNVNQHVVTTAPAKKGKKAVASPTAAGTSYDPGEYTIEEVLAHLEANPDLTAAVVKAEKSGKARVGITSLSG